MALIDDRPLRTVTRPQGANAALLDGEIYIPGVSLDFQDVPVLVQGFRRMVREEAYDVCEMALTTYLCAKEHGARFTAIPTFLVRGLHHGAAVRRRDSSIVHPRDLEGRRVGVNRGYTVTTGVWARGILQDEHDVDLDAVTWVRADDEHVATYTPPPNVMDSGAGDSVADLLAGGSLDAAVGITADGSETLQPVIEDPDRAAFEAIHTHGVYPINHLVVVRDELLEEHEGLGRELFDALSEAKRRYVRVLRDGVHQPNSAQDHLMLRVMSAGFADPLPYGVAPNIEMLEQLLRYAFEQRILTSRPNLDGLFVADTLELTG